LYINLSFNINSILCNNLREKHFSQYLFSGEGGQMGYGRQRVWGTIGFGIAAFLAGYTVDLWSQEETYKTYTPAFLLVFVFTSIDLICCRKLEVIILRINKKEMNIMYVMYSFLLKIFILDFHLLYILITAAAYFRVAKYTERYMDSFEIETYCYISMFYYPCGYL